MKAVAVFPSSKQVKIIDHPEPSISSATDVKLRMIDVGVCGTDKEIVSFQYGTPPQGSEYLVIGHESLGEVVQTGPGVKTLKKGDLVVMMVRRPCDHPQCVACRVGRQDFCYTGDFTERGIKGRHGFMTEYVVDDEKYMNLVPGNLRDVAVLVEPLTIAQKAIEQLWQVQARLPWACPAEAGKPAQFCHNAVVLGAGPVGLLGAMALGCRGLRRTFIPGLRRPTRGPIFARPSALNTFRPMRRPWMKWRGRLAGSTWCTKPSGRRPWRSTSCACWEPTAYSFSRESPAGKRRSKWTPIC